MRFFLLGSILAAMLYRCPWVSDPGHCQNTHRESKISLLENSNSEPAGLRHGAEALGPTADLESKKGSPWRLTRLENQLLLVIPLDEKNLKPKRAPRTCFR